MTRALVTGGTGFVGANLARRLLADGHEVHLLVRRGYRDWRLADVRAALEFHEVALADADGLARAVAAIRPGWVFHLATHGAYSSQRDVQRIVDTNVVGTVNLVEACLRAGFEAFVNTGSSSEYGLKDHPPAETEWLEPNSHYAVTKAAATLYCRYTAQSRGVCLPTLRLYSVYGPYEEPTRLLPTLILRGLDGHLPPLVDPDVARDFVYVDDVVEAYLLAATCADQEPGAVYNVGTGTQTSLRQVVAVARATLGIQAEPAWGSMPNRRWDTTTWVADNRKIVRDLGWAPRYTFADGFQAFADWFRAHPELQHWYRDAQSPS
ncbi:MAG TPA: NAD-dependent epimerase/dehydratase family protein [Chloroflexota bacterium]|jgi:nucleoside-diphosphate-sugar epimerase